MNEELTKSNISKSTPSTKGKWAKRVGIGAFLFFFAKGLVWLGVAAAGAYYALN